MQPHIRKEAKKPLYFLTEERLGPRPRVPSREPWGERGDQLPECLYYPATPNKLLCQCVAIVWSWGRLPLSMAAILMTKSLRGSADNSAIGASTKSEANAPLSAQSLSCWVCKAAGQLVQGARPYKNTGEGLIPDIDYTGSVPPQYCL